MFFFQKNKQNASATIVAVDNSLSIRTQQDVLGLRVKDMCPLHVNFVLPVLLIFQVKWKSLSRVQHFATPWTVQTPWTEFSWPEYWSGQPFPSPRDLPNPGIEPRPRTLLVDSLPTELSGKPRIRVFCQEEVISLPSSAHTQALLPDSCVQDWGTRKKREGQEGLRRGKREGRVERLIKSYPVRADWPVVLVRRRPVTKGSQLWPLGLVHQQAS